MLCCSFHSLCSNHFTWPFMANYIPSVTVIYLHLWWTCFFWQFVAHCQSLVLLQNMAWCLNLQVGDWSAKIWSEDITESCLIWVFQRLTYITSTSNIPHDIIRPWLADSLVRFPNPLATRLSRQLEKKTTGSLTHSVRLGTWLGDLSTALVCPHDHCEGELWEWAADWWLLESNSTFTLLHHQDGWSTLHPKTNPILMPNCECYTQGSWRRGTWLKPSTARSWLWRCRRDLSTAFPPTLRSLHKILWTIHRVSLCRFLILLGNWF